MSDVTEKPVKFRTNSTGKVVELWIERSRWARSSLLPEDCSAHYSAYGQVNGESQLLNGQGGMCCLGFYSRACGVSSDGILEKSAPSDLEDLPEQMNWLATNNKHPMMRAVETDVASGLIGVNDLSSSDMLDPKEQEKKIRDGFAEQGIKIRFVK